MQAPASICPGYKHVEAFSNDDDYYESEEEEEEQVSYITLDLGDVEPQLVPNASTYRLIVRFFSPIVCCSMNSIPREQAK